MKVRVDPDSCIGCGTCEDLCPEVFRVGEDGCARVVADDPSPWADRVTQAAKNCPQDAISVEPERDPG